MFKRHWAFALALSACTLAACANGGGLVSGPSSGGGGGTGPSPLPSDTIGLLIPTGSIGVEKDPVWGTIAGFTQTNTSQVLAFAPGAKITIQNLSTTDPHTFNVIAVTGGPPANFPANPTLSFNPAGHGQLGTGYASGIINPMKSVTVTLSKPGIYLVGCAFHYSIGMRDVIQVVAGATPGPQATAPPSPAAKSRRVCRRSSIRPDGRLRWLAARRAGDRHVRLGALHRCVSADQRAVRRRRARAEAARISGASAHDHARSRTRFAAA